MFALDELLRRGGRDVWGPALAQQTGSRQLSQALISVRACVSVCVCVAACGCGYMPVLSTHRASRVVTRSS